MKNWQGAGRGRRKREVWWEGGGKFSLFESKTRKREKAGTEQVRSRWRRRPQR